MKFFLDTELWENGPDKPIQLISLALVSEKGNELYVLNQDFDWDACDSDWLKENVQPRLFDEAPIALPYNQIGNLVFKWVVRETGGKRPEFWGYYADYDWVIFCQTYGSMVNLPELYPKYCLDIKQLCMMMGDPALPRTNVGEHCALVDARWNSQVLEYLIQLADKPEDVPATRKRNRGPVGDVAC